MSKHSRANEQKFFNALRDIFVGARIEGESGYINLMRIKSRYYAEGVFPRLQEKIDEELQPFPAFREELFDKLYSFFKRYFSDSGSIYFRHTPYYQDIYERIYTDDRDVMLFWKTQNLYYVKTDRLFRSMTLNLDDAPDQKFAFDASAVERQSFNFDASGLQNKRNNEKRNLIFEYKGKSDDETLKFAVQYTEGGKKTKAGDILKAIKKDGVAVNEDQLTRAFRLFERQSEVDFFINKNARAFLDEQFDLWMYQYLFKRESDWTEKRIREMQALKRVARSIIEFISQFEDELVRIWNKPKFALSSNYVITFDRVFARSEEVARKLLAHENIEAQIAEWRELGMIDDSFTVGRIFETDAAEKPKMKKKKGEGNGSLFKEELSTNHTKSTKGDSCDSCDSWTDVLPELSARYRYLPFDTKHFKSLELEILSLFDNLDEELDGRLIHSENYQALNTLKDKFQEKVKCIYIDPPYNTGSDDFIYEDKFRHASWLSLIDNRVSLAREFLSSKGIFLSSIDDTQVDYLRLILESNFGEGGRLANFVWRRRVTSSLAQSWVSTDHEYILAYSLNPNEVEILGQERDMGKYNIPDIDGRFFASMPLTVGMNRSQRPNQWYELKNPRTGTGYWPPPNRVWGFYPPTMQKKVAEGLVIFPEDHPERRTTTPRLKVYPEDAKRDRKPLSSWIAEKKVSNSGKSETDNLVVLEAGKNEEGTRILKSFFGELPQIFPKPVSLITSLLEQFAASNDIICDFFAGSGTTAHAVINLNRGDGGQRKYILVEANDYFHTVTLPRVKKVVFSDKWKDGKAQADGKGASHFCKYFALEQYEDTLRRASYLNDSDTEQPAFFDNPYESPFASYVFLRDKKMADALAVDYDNNKISVDFSKLYPDIDWAETLSCVKGKFIRRVSADSVEFADGEVVRFDEIDYRDVLPLIWWDK
jgi:adenine specific DNA methylase Mod